jgi:hypothetical protein
MTDHHDERGGAMGSDQGTILAFVLAHLDPSGCGLLPGGDELPGADGDAGSSPTGVVRWMPGARDGVATHHLGAGVTDVDIGELVTLIGRAISSHFNPVEVGLLYERLRDCVTLAVIDELLGAVSRSALPRSGVAELGRRLAAAGRHVESIKTGIALLGIASRGEDRELLLTLGRHEEFTLYCAVAICNSEPEPDRVLWALARGVDGWGRIQAVERLRNTDDP